MSAAHRDVNSHSLKKPVKDVHQKCVAMFNWGMNNANAHFWNVTCLHLYIYIYVSCCTVHCRDCRISITDIFIFLYWVCMRSSQYLKKSYENLSFKLYHPGHFIAFQRGLNRTIQIRDGLLLFFSSDWHKGLAVGRKLCCESHTIKWQWHSMGSIYHQQYLKQTDFIALSAHQEVIHLQKVLIFILKTLPKGLCLSLPLQ